MNMTQSDLAYKYADRCIAISKKLGDENLEFNAEMIREAAQFSGWRDVFTVDFSKVRVNEEILRKLFYYIYLNNSFFPPLLQNKSLNLYNQTLNSYILIIHFYESRCIIFLQFLGYLLPLHF